MTLQLQGRTALVTGSTSNIGRAIALALAAQGAHVVVSGRDAARGASAVETIRAAGGRADFVAADLDGSSGRSRELADAALAVVGGRIDILVNNAGVFPPHSTPEVDDALMDHILGVNVKAPFFLTQALLPSMTAAGSGVVINLGSWVARLALASSPVYATSKGAVETLTRAWSAELSAAGVRVNAISPGVVRAEAPEQPDALEALMSGTPAGATGRPESIAAAVVFLASDDAAFIHGTVLDVDGGRTGVAVVAGT